MAAFNSDERLKALEEAAAKDETGKATEAMEVDPNPTAVLNSGGTARVAAKKDKEALIETGSIRQRIPPTNKPRSRSNSSVADGSQTP